MFDRLLSLYRGLTQREKLYVGLASAAVALTILSYPISSISEMVDDHRRLEIERAEDARRIAELLANYRRLDWRLKKVQETFAESEMTFEEMTAEIDRIVVNVVGAGKYTLQKDRTPTEIGGLYEKQGFTLELRSLTLDQLRKLLFDIENDKRPLFLEKTHIERRSGESFDANIDLFSIRKLGS